MSKFPTMEEALFSDTNPLDEVPATPKTEEPKPTKHKKESEFGWGGERTGSGRKPIYEGKLDSKRLKCKAELANLANAFINILGKYSPLLKNRAYACSFDGQDLKPKGYGLRKWIEYDAIMSDFPIVLDHQSDPRLFALAFVKSHAVGVEVEAVTPQYATLRWQRADEVARVMTLYGSMLARRNRLTSDEASILESIPRASAPADIANWIRGFLIS